MRVTCGPIRRRRPRRGPMATSTPSRSSGGCRCRCSTTTTVAWWRASCRTGRASGPRSSAVCCRTTSSRIATAGRARARTRGASRGSSAGRGATSWCRCRALRAGTTSTMRPCPPLVRGQWSNAGGAVPQAAGGDPARPRPDDRRAAPAGSRGDGAAAAGAVRGLRPGDGPGQLAGAGALQDQRLLGAGRLRPPRRLDQGLCRPGRRRLRRRG